MYRYQPHPIYMASVSVVDPDPGSGPFLTPGSGPFSTPGSGIGIFPDPGSWIPKPIPYFWELTVTIFWEKSTIPYGSSLWIGSNFFLYLLKKKKKKIALIFPRLFCCCCWIRDSFGMVIKIRIRDKHSGSTTLFSMRNKTSIYKYLLF